MEVLKNYINGKWVESVSNDSVDVINPATGKLLAKVPFGESTADDVENAASAAYKAYLLWKDVPVLKRIQPLYKLKFLFEISAFNTSGSVGINPQSPNSVPIYPVSAISFNTCWHPL